MSNGMMAVFGRKCSPFEAFQKLSILEIMGEPLFNVKMECS